MGGRAAAGRAVVALAVTVLAGRKIFVYIGNMGVAQSMDIFIELIQGLRHRDDIGFLFVGRGSEFAKLEAEKASRELNNVLFFGEIDSSEIPGLLAQCHVGLVALHPDHKTHNIPGKFVSYVQYGLPVLARVNAGTDLERLIEDEQVGQRRLAGVVAEDRDGREGDAEVEQADDRDRDAGGTADVAGRVAVLAAERGDRLPPGESPHEQRGRRGSHDSESRVRRLIPQIPQSSEGRVVQGRATPRPSRRT